MIGLLVYLALLVAALRPPAARRVHVAARARRSPPPSRALVVHTLLYAAFLEDPLTWVLLGVGAALAWQLQPSPRERALAREERRAARAAVRVAEQAEPAVS